VPIPLAIGTGLVLGIGSLVRPMRCLVEAGAGGWLYVVITTAYSLYFKRVPVIELAFCGLGLRLWGPCRGGGHPCAHLHLVLGREPAFGALFVHGKRAPSSRSWAMTRKKHRAALGDYTTSFLQSTLTAPAAVTVTAYACGLWVPTALAAPCITIRSGSNSPSPVTLGILHVLRLWTGAKAELQKICAGRTTSSGPGG